MPAYAVSAAILCCFQRRFLSFKPPQILCLPILSPRMDTADIQGKLLAYFNQLSPEARDRLLASAPAQEVQPQPASGSGNAQPSQTMPTKAPPSVVTGKAQAQTPDSGPMPNPASDSASALLTDELAAMKEAASTRRGQKAKALSRKDWDFIDPAQKLSWSQDQILLLVHSGRRASPGAASPAQGSFPMPTASTPASAGPRSPSAAGNQSPTATYATRARTSPKEDHVLGLRSGRLDSQKGPKRQGAHHRSRLRQPNCPCRPGRPPSPGSALHGVQHMGPAVCCGPCGAFLYHQPSAGTATAGPSPGSPHHASHCPRAGRHPRRPAPGRLHRLAWPGARFLGSRAPQPLPEPTSPRR